jgi:hypothetical protein
MSDKSFMNGDGESYSAIVSTKHPNKSAQAQAEDVEKRALTKENTQQPNPCRAQKRESG